MICLSVFDTRLYCLQQRQPPLATSTSPSPPFPVPLTLYHTVSLPPNPPGWYTVYNSFDMVNRPRFNGGYGNGRGVHPRPNFTQDSLYPATGYTARHDETLIIAVAVCSCSGVSILGAIPLLFTKSKNKLLPNDWRIYRTDKVGNNARELPLAYYL